MAVAVSIAMLNERNRFAIFAKVYIETNIVTVTETAIATTHKPYTSRHSQLAFHR